MSDSAFQGPPQNDGPEGDVAHTNENSWAELPNTDGNQRAAGPLFSYHQKDVPYTTIKEFITQCP